MCVYLRTKFQVSSIVLTSFRQVVEVVLLPNLKTTPKKNTQIRVKLFDISKIYYMIQRFNSHSLLTNKVAEKVH